MLACFVERLSLGPIQRAGALEILPLLLADPQPLGEIGTLDGALNQAQLEIQEVDGGQVGAVRASNRSGGHLLLLDGEEIVGARQDRILSATVLLAPGAQVLLPVSCVERGRWRQASTRFQSGGRMASATIRSARTRHVTRSAVAGGRHAADQGEIWRQVAQQTARLGASHPTEAMQAGHTRHADRLQRETTQVRTLPGQVGALALFRRQVLAMDVLGDARLYRQVRRKLLESYALDTIGRESASRWEDPVRVAERFLRQLREAPARRVQPVGDGVELRLSAPGVEGSALLLDGAVVHLAAFGV